MTVKLSFFQGAHRLGGQIMQVHPPSVRPPSAVTYRGLVCGRHGAKCYGQRRIRICSAQGVSQVMESWRQLMLAPQESIVKFSVIL